MHVSVYALVRTMANRINELRGLGYGRRFAFTPSQLPRGWRQEKQGAKCTVWYDEKGTRYKSSTEVSRALSLLDETISDTCEETECSGEETTDRDETSEYEPSPCKKATRSFYVSIYVVSLVKCFIACFY